MKSRDYFVESDRVFGAAGFVRDKRKDVDHIAKVFGSRWTISDDLDLESSHFAIVVARFYLYRWERSHFDIRSTKYMVVTLRFRIQPKLVVSYC